VLINNTANRQLVTSQNSFLTITYYLPKIAFQRWLITFWMQNKYTTLLNLSLNRNYSANMRIITNQPKPFRVQSLSTVFSQ